MRIYFFWIFFLFFSLFFLFFFEKWNIKALFSLPIKSSLCEFQEKSWGIGLFSVDQLENNDRSRSKEGVLYCLLTYNL